MKMILKGGWLGQPGETVSRYGYPGVVEEDGRVILDVPEEFAEMEKAAGRLVAVNDPDETGGPPPPPPGPPGAEALDHLTVAQMRDWAKRNGVTLPREVNTREEIVEHLTNFVAKG